jgi:hypothetical protein
VTVRAGDLTIGVVRVAESSDTPHITNDGVIYVRDPGGKQRVIDHRDILALARRGELARVDVEQRLYGLPMMVDAMRTPERIWGEDPSRLDELGPLTEMLVRATPYTVSGELADRALSSPLVEHAKHVVVSLLSQVRYPCREPVLSRGRGRPRASSPDGIRCAHLPL